MQGCVSLTAQAVTRNSRHHGCLGRSRQYVFIGGRSTASVRRVSIMGVASKPNQGPDQPQPDSGLTTRTTPGPRSRSSGGRMRPTLSVLRARRGPDAGPDTVADDLKACLQPKLTASCMNPDCSKKCKWPAGRGRPPLFHDRLCHEKYHLIRRRLVAEIADIDKALGGSRGPRRRSGSTWRTSSPDVVGWLRATPI